MVTKSVQTDKGIGLAAFFGMLALLGAVAMLAAPGQVAKAWGFGGAMVAAILAVAVLHIYG
jgi:hypothetical protein